MAYHSMVYHTLACVALSRLIQTPGKTSLCIFIDKNYVLCQSKVLQQCNSFPKISVQMESQIPNRYIKCQYLLSNALIPLQCWNKITGRGKKH